MAMTRIESKWLLKRGKKWCRLWDYCSVLEWNTIKYILTLDHVEIYRDLVDINDMEINFMLHSHMHTLGTSSIYDKK